MIFELLLLKVSNFQESMCSKAGMEASKGAITNTLRFKTKLFPNRVKLQYLGDNSEGKHLFSDSVHYYPMDIGKSYKSIFQKKLISPLTIIECVNISRDREPSFDLVILNLEIAAKEFQINAMVGEPILYVHPF